MIVSLNNNLRRCMEEIKPKDDEAAAGMINLIFTLPDGRACDQYGTPMEPPGVIKGPWAVMSLEDDAAAIGPENFAANMIQGALDRGEMTKPLACDTCGSAGDLVGMPADFAKPLVDVKWLCEACRASTVQRYDGRPFGQKATEGGEI